jgi:hypothetical protein
LGFLPSGWGIFRTVTRPTLAGRSTNCDYFGHWKKECNLKKEAEEEAKAHAALAEESEEKDINVNSRQANNDLIAHTAFSSLPNHLASDVYLDSSATLHMFHHRFVF